MDKIYLKRRGKKSYTSYRLNKRTDVIIDSLKEFVNNGAGYILDVGTADGKMLHRVATHFNIKWAVGIDTSQESIEIANQLKDVKVFLGNFINLPFREGVFDILLACAILEHIGDIDAVLKESHRVLKNGGLFCVTVPNPFYDWINSKLVKTYHLRRYRLKQLVHIIEGYGFKIVKASYFMLCPFGQPPLEEGIIKIIQFLKLDFILFNQVIIGMKK
ncbi:MAG: class I SAM-dependent methyltransferase [Candidatus Lokiarchaeia archaeon]